MQRFVLIKISQRREFAKNTRVFFPFRENKEFLETNYPPGSPIEVPAYRQAGFARFIRNQVEHKL
ncbi:MAG: hypothetical protein ACJA1B_001027 [Polaribacter sp.]|jgi:hypothetical protein